ncbi:MAG TPA: DUF4845 domain-containing protein [Albitalea sp.]|nr:DUF4845 domain-containing protein [Albitalea sp.]
MTVRHRAVSRQRGITLLGLLFWAIIIGFVALLGMRVIPTVIEYTTIQKAVNRIVTEGLTTVPEIRTAFDRQRDVEFSIQAVSGKDLDITKENDKVVIGFAYNKEVEIMSPVFLLIKYKGGAKAK